MAKPEPDESQEETGYFHLQRLFPDPVAVFGFKPRSLDEDKGTCLVVLDTNVLLNPYGVSSQALSDIEKCFKALISQNRLVIPSHVAREFARLRAKKISEILDILNRDASLAKDAKVSGPSSLHELPEYVALKEKENAVAGAIAEFRKSHRQLLDRIRAWNCDDPVSELYRRMFTAGVIRDSGRPEVELEKEAMERARLRMPPGYKDAAKDVNAAGDFLIWDTILHVAGQQKKPVVFVTHETKADWWYRWQGEPLQPRFELTDEFRRRSDGNSFHMLTFSKMLSLFNAGEVAVAEVKREEAQTQFGDAAAPEEAVASQLESWLMTKYQGESIEWEPRWLSCDCVVTNNVDQLVLVDIWSPNTFNAHAVSAQISRLEEKAREAYAMEPRFRTFHLVVVTNRKLAEQLSKALSFYILNKKKALTYGVVTVGFMTSDGFTALREWGRP